MPRESGHPVTAALRVEEWPTTPNRGGYWIARSSRAMTPRWIKCRKQITSGAPMFLQAH
jgi:hypothetical protein